MKYFILLVSLLVIFASADSTSDPRPGKAFRRKHILDNDNEVALLTELMRNVVERTAKIKGHYQKFKPEAYIQQIANGDIYYVKVKVGHVKKVGPNNYVWVKFQLPSSEPRRPNLVDLKTGKIKSDELTVF